MSIYDKDGWLNIKYINGFKANFNIIVGERQIGKTYGVLKDLFYTKEDRHVMILRRTREECEMIGSNPDLNPFIPINRDTGECIYINSIGRGVYSIDKLTGKDENDKNTYLNKGMLLSLGAMAKMRGFDGSLFTDLVFDEFIPERHVHRLKNEADSLKNAITTISGNRELRGKPPLKIWLLANSNNLDDDILSGMHIISDFEYMLRRGKSFKFDEKRSMLLVMSNKSPVADRRKENALYKFLDGFKDDFTEMAFNAKFSYNDMMYVERIHNTNILQPYIQIGNLYVYKWKETGNPYLPWQFYVCDKKYKEFKKNYTFGDNTEELRRFNNRYFNFREYVTEGLVYFNSYETKVTFYKYIKLSIDF